MNAELFLSLGINVACLIIGFILGSTVKWVVSQGPDGEEHIHPEFAQSSGSRINRAAGFVIALLAVLTVLQSTATNIRIESTIEAQAHCNELFRRITTDRTSFSTQHRAAINELMLSLTKLQPVPPDQQTPEGYQETQAAFDKFNREAARIQQLDETTAKVSDLC